MLRILSLFCVLTVLLTPSSAVQSDRVLVLLENLTVKETHSIYFKNLVDAGFELTFKVADDSGLQIKKYGQFLYEHIIVFSPTVEEFGGELSAEALTEFVDEGGNILVAANSNTGEVRDLNGSFGNGYWFKATSHFEGPSTLFPETHLNLWDRF